VEISYAVLTSACRKASYNASCYSLSIHIVIVLNFVSALTVVYTLVYDTSAVLFVY